MLVQTFIAVSVYSSEQNDICQESYHNAWICNNCLGVIAFKIKHAPSFMGPPKMCWLNHEDGFKSRKSILWKTHNSFCVNLVKWVKAYIYLFCMHQIAVALDSSQERGVCVIYYCGWCV